MKKLEDTTYICRCQEVEDWEIRQAIADGCQTLKGVKNRTEAMMGLCQGRTCRRLIEKLLAENTKSSLSQPSFRPPVRTLPLKELVEEGDDKHENC